MSAEKIVEQSYVATTQDHLAQIMAAIGDRFDASTYGACRFGDAGHGASLDFLTSFGARQLADLSELDRLYPPSRDPVMQHLRTSSKPIFWDAEIYRDSGQSEVHRLMSDIGMVSGISVPLHLSPSQHFILGIAWDRPIALDARVLSDLQMLTIFTWPAFSRTWSMIEFDEIAPAAPLTHRECECLYWVGRGMTDPMIAELLGISRRTAERTVQSAYGKLYAANRIEGAVIAARLGLTEPFRLLNRKPRVASFQLVKS